MFHLIVVLMVWIACVGTPHEPRGGGAPAPVSAPVSAFAFAPAIAFAPAFAFEKDGLALQLDEVEGVPVEEFIDLFKEITGYPIKYAREDVRGRSIRIRGTRKLDRDRAALYAYFEAVMACHGFICLGYGPEREPYFYAVYRVATAGEAGGECGPGLVARPASAVDPAGNRGRVIPRELLDQSLKDPAGRITTTFPVTSARRLSSLVDVLSRQGIALDLMRAENGSASYAVVTGSAIEVWGIFRLLGAGDLTRPGLANRTVSPPIPSWIGR